MFLDPAADACAGPLSKRLVADYDDERALLELAGQVDVVTFDFENVPARSLEVLAGRVPVHPGARALAAGRRTGCTRRRCSASSAWQRRRSRWSMALPGCRQPWWHWAARAAQDPPVRL